MEVNIYQKAIEQLVLEGNTILQVCTPNKDEFLFFAVYKWQEGYFNIFFCLGKGDSRSDVF